MRPLVRPSVILNSKKEKMERTRIVNSEAERIEFYQLCMNSAKSGEDFKRLLQEYHLNKTLPMVPKEFRSWKKFLRVVMYLKSLKGNSPEAYAWTKNTFFNQDDELPLIETDDDEKTLAECIEYVKSFGYKVMQPVEWEEV